MAFQHWQSWQAQIHGQIWYIMLKAKYIDKFYNNIMIKLKYMVKRKLLLNV